MKCWGSNGNGQCGLGQTSNIGDDVGEMGDYLPTLYFPTSVKIVAIGSGWSATGLTIK